MLNSSLASLLEIVVHCGRWLFDRFARRGFVVTLRTLRNSCHRIKRRIQRLQRRKLPSNGYTKRNERICNRIDLHRWRLSARRLAIKWLENYAHEYDVAHVVEFVGGKLETIEARPGVLPQSVSGAPYAWELRGATA